MVEQLGCHVSSTRLLCVCWGPSCVQAVKRSVEPVRQCENQSQLRLSAILQRIFSGSVKAYTHIAGSCDSREAFKIVEEAMTSIPYGVR